MAQTATQSKAADKKPAEAVKQTAKVVEQHSKKIADSAKELEQSSVRIEDSADRTTRLAAERTYAAWVRTGLFALASGIGARALLTGLLPEWLIQADASMLIAFSIFCFGAAIWRHLNPGPPPPRPAVQQIPRAVLMVVNGFLALVSLAALIGIWTNV
jgi:putative membrane protein